jgi:hypothetical protein
MLSMEGSSAPWLLLIHQIPTRPTALRVKTWRQLQRIGAVAIKSTVYALPATPQAHEEFAWIARAVVEGGGDASICEARFAAGLTDDQIVALFVVARDADYAAIAEDVRQIDATVVPNDDDARTRLQLDLARLQRRLAEVIAIDFFATSGREVAETLVADLERRARRPAESARVGAAVTASAYRGRTWITRQGIHVDRMASAWLIRRFIDPDARLLFVDASAPPIEGVRFDMFEAEFTHEGDRCTFEVLIERFGLVDPALVPLAEIVHDIDLKDGKFGRPDTAGVAAALAGIALVHRDDQTRLVRSADLFDALAALYRRKPTPKPRGEEP